MSNFEREQYEISIWEDYSLQTGGGVEIEERKIAIIGSNEMDAISRAFNPRFSSNMNQVKSLSFDIYQKYRDENGELVANPFATMIQNETKIKLKFRGEWHDFIVKNIVEDSYNYTLRVQCKDLHTHVLSRIGYDIEFDIELENNIGTLQELANTTFSNTEWEVLSEGEIFREKKEEPVYEVLASRAFSGYLVTDTDKDLHTIPVGSTILIFHSDVMNFEEGVAQLQFVYSSTYSVDRDLLVLNEDSNYVVEGITVTTQTIGGQPTWVVKIGSNTIFTLEKRQSLSDDYRANKYIQSQHLEYDAKLGRYVKVYTDSLDNKRYGYTETTYQSPLTVRDLITNGKNFLNAIGWSPANKVIFKTYQSSTGIDSLKSYLFAKMTAGEVIQNSGIRDRANYLLDGLVKGEKLIVRAKVRTGTDTAPGNDLVNGHLTMSINGGTYVSSQTSNGYHVWSITVPKTYSYSELVNNQAILRIRNTQQTTNYWIEEIQLFKEVLDSNNNRIIPGAIDVEPVVQVENFFYDPTQSYSTQDDIVYESKDPSLYTPKFDGSYEKRRSVSISKSNLFNIAQELAEKFECWAVLKVTHDVDGKITNRAVQFTQKTGTRRPAGFVYGLDLQGIQRTVDSAQISTKVIVEPNQNELSEHGYCSIAEAPENYSGENFIYNFNYYVQKGLIPFGQLQNDLYASDANLGIGLITGLHIHNKERDLLIAKQGLIRKNLTELRADKSFYENSLIAAKNQSSELFNKLVGLSGKNTLPAIQTWLANGSVEAKNIYTQYREVGKIISANETLVQNRDNELTQEENRLKTTIADLKTNFDAKKDLVNLFNSKYYRFIQEGVWTSPDYYDNNMYYFDALGVSNSSAFPKIQYAIKVTSLAGLEEFKGKFFNVGDITTIEDTEYFGYVSIGGVRTPYKEEILVTDMTYNLDQPELDEITVQNYRPNFEELFQRITATTQSLQLAQGGYERAARAITPQGTIDLSVLQHSLTVNQDLVYSSNNSSYVQDHTGITMTDLNNTKHSTRYTPKGLFFTQDGGINWNVGVTAQGVSTAALTAGIIYTDNIVISQGGAPTFRWDNVGLTAYKFGDTGLEPGTFVRHDQYGFYGVTEAVDENDEPGFIPTSEQDVWDNAKFALTWSGFNLKTSHQGEDGYVRITSASDEVPEISVGAGGTKRVEIGRLGQNVYGLRISDAEGNPVITANSDGTISLEDILYINKNGSHSVAIGKLTSEEFIQNSYRKLTLVPDINPDFEGSGRVRVIGKPIIGNVYENIAGDYVLTTDTMYQENKEYYIYSSQVFNANSNFIVFEDGSVEANDGVFKGFIEATGGSFTGSVTATDGYFRGIVDATSGVFRGQIEADAGFIGNTQITADGLLVRDGSFIIQGKDDEENYYSLFDFSDNKLRIAGDAIFSGQLEAYSGTIGGLNISAEEIYVDTEDGTQRAFSVNSFGELTALTGTIGGIKILSDGLASNTYVTSEGEEGYKLDSSGTIYAKNIYLGSSAHIEDYLQLGSSGSTKLMNPDLNSGMVLESGDLRIYETGVASFGDIQVSGPTSEIWTADAWRLSPTLASFANISASGSISTMVFESNSTRVAGGSMIFKTSAKPIDFTSDSFTLESKDAQLFNADDWVLLQENEGQKVERKIASVDVTTGLVTLTSPHELSTIELVVNYGGVDDSNLNSKEWIIGINSGSTIYQNYLYPNAISFSSFSETEVDLTIKTVLYHESESTYTPTIHTHYQPGTVYYTNTGTEESPIYVLANNPADGEPTELKFSPKIILGQLNNLPDFIGSTYGLYAESAYLKGTLTTSTSTNSPTYAGVNTISGVPYNKDTEELDTSRIIFWAGAIDGQDLSIQNSPFQVTEKGTLYATKGYFTQSVFVEAEIQASVLRTAKIIGDTTSPALTIYDTHAGTGGIVFMDSSGTPGEESDDKETMRLSSSGINLLQGAVKVSDQTVIGPDGDIYTPLLTIRTGALYDMTVGAEGSDAGSIALGGTRIDLKSNLLDFSVNNVPVFSSNNEETSLTNSLVKIAQNLSLGTTSTLTFEEVDGGYDIYVS